MSDPVPPHRPGEPDDQGPDPVEEALERADALLSVGRTAEAEAALRRALADEPDDPFLLGELARVLFRAERLDDGREHLERAIAGAPEIGRFRGMRAVVLAADPRRTAEALAEAREGVRIDPEDPQVHLMLAWVSNAAARPRDGLAAADRAVALDPEDADAHAARGDALVLLLRTEEAEEAYREALARSPEDPELLRSLAVAVGARGRAGREENRELLRAAVRADPTDVAAREELASEVRRSVYGRIGWFIVAFALVRATMQLFGDEATSLKVIGMLLWLGFAAVVATFVVVRGRRRSRKLGAVEQRVFREHSGVLQSARRGADLVRAMAFLARRR